MSGDMLFVPCGQTDMKSVVVFAVLRMCLKRRAGSFLDGQEIYREVALNLMLRK
jgi:hypothetical protein